MTEKPREKEKSLNTNEMYGGDGVVAAAEGRMKQE